MRGRMPGHQCRRGSPSPNAGTSVKTFTLERSDVGALLDALKRRGYTLLGPTVRDSAIVIDEISRVEDLPVNWTDVQSGASYRLKRREDNAFFGFAVGPTSWKRFLYPPIQHLFAMLRAGKSFALPAGTKESTPSRDPKMAFIGVRPCDVHALAIHDRVLLAGPFVDPLYQLRRNGCFVVAVNCTQAGGTCFCASMNTGPRATEGFDLALTELITHKRHYFLVETGSDRGEALLKSVPVSEAGADEMKEARAACEQAQRQMGRSLDTKQLREVLYQNAEHPRWDAIGARCLTCANCTMVCPTCFCATVEDVTDLGGSRADRIRKWDSCFTLDFSYIHGGSVRASAKARYRQWMTHKLASWVDQFGTSGCVGCGRCITWCPVGIDITEEARAIREGQPTEARTHA